VPVAIFEEDAWQMSLGERAAVEGVLSQLRPALAIEIGSAQGACLRRIATHAAEVHSFDLTEPSLPQPGNVVLHTGDSHTLLPAFLAQLSERERNVDFVIVDGDHSEEGVRRDLQDLLDAPCLARTVILIHDTANERVRAGLDALRFAAWPKVTGVDLDWVPGRLFAEPSLHNELWYGLGLVTVDTSMPAWGRGPVHEQRYRPSAPLLAEARALAQIREASAGVGALPDGSTAMLTGELVRLRAREAGLRAELERCRGELAGAEARLERADRTLSDVMGSPSWRVTRPLRAAKRIVRPGG
jgi:hypothetical protein